MAGLLRDFGGSSETVVTIGPPAIWTTKLHLEDSGTGVTLIEPVLSEQALRSSRARCHGSGAAAPSNPRPTRRPSSLLPARLGLSAQVPNESSALRVCPLVASTHCVTVMGGAATTILPLGLDDGLLFGGHAYPHGGSRLSETGKCSSHATWVVVAVGRAAQPAERQSVGSRARTN